MALAKRSRRRAKGGYDLKNADVSKARSCLASVRSHCRGDRGAAKARPARRQAEAGSHKGELATVRKTPTRMMAFDGVAGAIAAGKASQLDTPVPTSPT